MRAIDDLPLKEAKTPLFVDDERGALVLQATFAIDAIATLVIKAMGDDNEDTLAVREVMKRVKNLNNLIMSAVGDELETTEKLRKRFN